MMPDKAATQRTQPQGSGKRQLVMKVVWGPSSMGPPSCCGIPMVAQLAQAWDRYGQNFYATVWRCPQCGKSVY